MKDSPSPQVYQGLLMTKALDNFEKAGDSDIRRTIRVTLVGPFNVYGRQGKLWSFWNKL